MDKYKFRNKKDKELNTKDDQDSDEISKKHKSHILLPKIRNKIKLTCVYNFKGGVAKTTTTHSLLESMRQTGEIMVFDLDFQCNLTSLLNKEIKAITEYLEEKGDDDDDIEIPESMIEEPDNNIHKLWQSVLDGRDMEDNGEGIYTDVIKNVLDIKLENNLVFVPGTKKLFQVDRWLSTREAELRDRFKLVDIILRLADSYKIQNVLVDLNPGDSLLNRTLLHRSDHIITPTFLDHSSVSSTHNFVRILMREIELTGITSQSSYEKGESVPIVCVSKYKRYSGRLVKLHRKWVQLLEKVCEKHAGKFMLCPQIETTAMGRKHNSLYDIGWAADENSKINEYRKNIDKLRDHVMGITDGEFTSFDMDSE